MFKGKAELVDPEKNTPVATFIETCQSDGTHAAGPAAPGLGWGAASVNCFTLLQRKVRVQFPALIENSRGTGQILGLLC